MRLTENESLITESIQKVRDSHPEAGLTDSSSFGESIGYCALNLLTQKRRGELFYAHIANAHQFLLLEGDRTPVKTMTEELNRAMEIMRPILIS